MPSGATTAFDTKTCTFDITDTCSKSPEKQRITPRCTCTVSFSFYNGCHRARLNSGLVQNVCLDIYFMFATCELLLNSSTFFNRVYRLLKRRLRVSYHSLIKLIA